MAKFAMRAAIVLLVFAVSDFGFELEGTRISAVEVRGGPASLVETRAGDTWDAARLRRDVKTLWKTGRYSDIRVEAIPGVESVRLIFWTETRRSLHVRKVRVEPATPGIHVGIASGDELDNQAVQQAVVNVRKQLEGSGFPDAAVDARLLPAARSKTDLLIQVQKGRQIDIGEVTFSGELGLTESEARKALRATRSKTMLPGLPGLWRGWRLLPAYSPEAIESDAGRVRSLYFEHGYFDADVRIESNDVHDGKARVVFAVEAGQRYRVNGVKSPGSLAPLCRQLLAQRREAQRAGILDFSPRLAIHDTANGWVDVTASVQRGQPYRIGRIHIRGNHRVSEATVRRCLLIEEGGPMDEYLLRRSLARLNQIGLFELLTINNVNVNTPPDSDRADIIIWLKEKKARNWFLSGPAGPMSLAGPLEFALGTRLPPWGRGLLELSTYSISANVMLFAKPLNTLLPFLPHRRFLAVATIQRPILPGQPLASGFAVAPQLGWRGMLAGYGASQARALVRPSFEGRHTPEPELAVTVLRSGREGTMYCEDPRTKLDSIRQAGGFAMNLLFAASPF